MRKCRRVGRSPKSKGSQFKVKIQAQLLFQSVPERIPIEEEQNSRGIASGNIGLPLLNDDFARSVIDIAIDARAFDVDDDGNDQGTEGKGTAGVTPPADPR